MRLTSGEFCNFVVGIMGRLFHDINARLTGLYGKDEARAISLLLLERTEGLSSADVLMGRDDELPETKKNALQPLVERLLVCEPIQYVTGEADFCGMTLAVKPGVLIPRPETEELVDSVVRLLDGHGDRVRLLDIGTGSGCIALALKQKLGTAEVTGLDVSDEALDVARENAKRLQLDVTFRHEDILSAIPPAAAYDAIVSNPPYICTREKAEMDANVLDYEPQIALFVPDDNPLLFYNKIIRYAQCALKDGGLLAFETNRLYGADVAEQMRSCGFAGVTVSKDMFDNDRMVTGWKQRSK